MAIVVRLQHHHIHLILNLQNENKNKMLNRLSFLSENDDPQKYMGYDREGSDNRHKRDKCHHKAAQYKEYQE